MPRIILAAAVAAASLAVAGMQPAHAGEAAVAETQRAAYAGDFAGGIAKLKAMSSRDANDVEAVMGAGVLQVFQAVATLQAGLYRHSMPVPQTGPGLGLLTGMVPMRMGLGGPALVPVNPKATPMTYRALRGILERFVSDLATAEATLALVKDRPAKLTLQPTRIAIDLDHNGRIEPNERLFGVLMGLRGPGQDVEFAFDTADASWLRGYTNVLMATTNLFLAFDFERTFEATAHNTYGLATTALGREIQSQLAKRRAPSVLEGLIREQETRLKVLQDERTVRQAELNAIRTRLQALPRPPEAQDERRTLLEEQRLANERWSRANSAHTDANTQIQNLKAELAGVPPGQTYAGIMDLVAAIHTMNWTVVEPKRLAAVRTHMLQVMALNENTWRLARAETDDDREWLPNARQTSPFAIKPTDEIIDSWIATTRLAADVLNGRKLLPHPRFPNKGVNLKTFFETARSFDLVGAVTGHALVPFLEEGDIVDGGSWRAIANPMQQNMALFAVWFN